jgi:hypothetical protein
MNRIQTYNNFLNEVADVGETVKNFKDFLKTFENKYIKLIIRQESNNTTYLQLKEANFDILYIIIKHGINIEYYENILPQSYDYIIEYDKNLYNYITDYINNFYDLLKKSDKIIKFLKEDSEYILNTPIIDVEKYCDFIVYVYENINNNVLSEFFESSIFMSEFYTDIKETFIKKYKHLVDASSFDLI